MQAGGRQRWHVHPGRHIAATRFGESSSDTSPDDDDDDDDDDKQNNGDAI